MKRYSLFLILPLLLHSQLSQAEIVVIGHPQLAVDKLDVLQVKRLFLGKSHVLESGRQVELVDHPEGSAIRDKFYTQVTAKNAAQLRAYWAKRVFSGKGIPPAVLAGDADVLQWVAKTEGGLGYVEADNVTGTVKILLHVK